ncbi:unnamed protein product, partial [Rotaria sp. Silwood2]
MPPTTLHMDITGLPPDVISLYDESFYELARKLAGPIEADLLELQGIRSAYSLIHTEDIFDILKYECKALDQIKKRLAFYWTIIDTSSNLGVKQTSNDDNNNNNNTLASQSSAQVLPTSSPLSPTTATETPGLYMQIFGVIIYPILVT